MEVYHEKFGTGTILNSTEQFDEAGNIVSADVMFEHGIEQDIQLDELSKKTLGSYIKKSADSAVDNARDSDDSGNRSLDRRYYDADQRKTHATDSKNYFNKSQKRLSGISKATSKLTKEEIEDLDELSKKTLGSYIKKSADSAVDNARDSDDSGNRSLDRRYYDADQRKTHATDSKNYFNKSQKRLSGISKATSKLTKEEIEDLENDILDIVDEAVNSALNEKLSGNQHKIDANKNGKVDAHDFKLLRGKKTDTDEMGGKDFTKIKESVEVTPRMTPDSASMRMPAVESVVRDIMSQQRNLREEAKIAEFKSRNK